MADAHTPLGRYLCGTRNNHADPGSQGIDLVGHPFPPAILAFRSHSEYTQQTLTIPLPTNTADPELAILTTFFYMKMARTSQSFSDLLRPPSGHHQHTAPRAQICRRPLYRLSLGQQGVSQRFNYNVATVVLDLITSNHP